MSGYLQWFQTLCSIMLPLKGREKSSDCLLLQLIFVLNEYKNVELDHSLSFFGILAKMGFA